MNLAIDQWYTGWGSDTADGVGAPLAPQIVVQLPHAIRVTEFGLMPTAVCGDDYTGGQ